MEKFNVFDPKIFELSDNPKISHKYVENYKITIVDNFYKYPINVREFSYKVPMTVLPVGTCNVKWKRWMDSEGKLKFSKEFDEGFGECFRGSWASWNSLDSQSIQNFIGKILKKDINIDKFMFSFFKFYEEFYDKSQEMGPHVDSSPFAGLIYLNDDRDCRGGTGFYKHRDTKSYFSKHTEKLSNNWDMIESIKMKFNRLAIYPGNLYHSVYHSKGDFSDNYRVTQNFFIK